MDPRLEVGPWAPPLGRRAARVRGYAARVVSSELSFFARLWLAHVCFWRVLLGGSFAPSVARLLRGGETPPLPQAPVAAPPPVATPPAPPPLEDALQLLSLFQREGRLVDFLEQDIASFSDADIGAAARVVHDGCRRALRGHAKLSPVRSEAEGAKVTLSGELAPDEVKLTGNVQGKPPYTGVLRHRGWRITELALPVAVRGHDLRVLAPAEVEL